MTFDFLSITAPLFVPGHQPERFEKARAAAPDAIILDLEDAVAADLKDRARTAVGDFVANAGRSAPLIVRLNPLDTPFGLYDLAAVSTRHLRPAAFALPKVESPRDIELLRAHAGDAIAICALVETARGLDGLGLIAAALRPGDALALGGADLAVDLNARFGWDALLFARIQLVQRAALHRLAVLDVPFLGIRDDDGLRSETARVRDLGFSGKLAIHPAQVGPIRDVFTPTEDEHVWAKEILDALEKAGGSAVQVRGKLVDEPLRAMANRILTRT